MSPLVRDGDIVLVRPVVGGKIKVGDVVLRCDEEGHLVVHRVVRRLSSPTGHALATQGDQCIKPDGVFPTGQVYGKVVALERAGKQIDLEQSPMRVLAHLAVLRSRINLGRGMPSRLARRVLKQVPGLSWYLA